MDNQYHEDYKRWLRHYEPGEYAELYGEKRSWWQRLVIRLRWW